MTPLTDKQAAILAFLRRYFWENDMLPPSRTIQLHFGFASQTSAMVHMKALARKGAIERNEAGKWRFSR